MFEKGNVFEEQDRDGWVYGAFMPEGLCRDQRVEIKVKKLKKGFTSPPHYQKTCTKIELIWQGKAIWELDGKEVEMGTGDYAIIPSKVKVAIKKILSDELIVQTIKIPSIPGDKVETGVAKEGKEIGG